MMALLPACGYCRHWGNGEGVPTVPVADDWPWDLVPPPRDQVRANGRAHFGWGKLCRAPHAIPTDAPAALCILATNASDGLGCVRFECDCYSVRSV